MDMISLAHKATPYGHVLVNGNAPDVTILARIVGVGESECETLVQELETNGVFSRTRKGVIYSRRMVRDEKKATHARNIGKKGGNPSLYKQTHFQDQDNQPDKPPDKPHIPDARDQRPERKKESSLRSDSSIPARNDFCGNGAVAKVDEVRQAVEAWNDLAEERGLAKCQKLTDARRSQIRRRLQDSGGIEGWRSALDLVRDSPFLLGQNDRKWKADIDFLLKESKFTKLMEGGYTEKSGVSRAEIEEAWEAING